VPLAGCHPIRDPLAPFSGCERTIGQLVVSCYDLSRKPLAYSIFRIFGDGFRAHSGNASGAFPGSTKENTMRKALDCRDYPSAIKCTVALSADSPDELLEIAAAHAVSTHGHTDTPELRTTLRGMFRDVPDTRPAKG
jgi:predicted small metal-binding protein